MLRFMIFASLAALALLSGTAGVVGVTPGEDGAGGTETAEPGGSGGPEGAVEPPSASVGIVITMFAEDGDGAEGARASVTLRARTAPADEGG